jgi:hypothetical protein
MATKKALTGIQKSCKMCACVPGNPREPKNWLTHSQCYKTQIRRSFKVKKAKEIIQAKNNRLWRKVEKLNDMSYSQKHRHFLSLLDRPHRKMRVAKIEHKFRPCVPEKPHTPNRFEQVQMFYAGELC